MRRIVLAAFVLLPLVAFARIGGPQSAHAGAGTDLDLALDCDVAAAGIQADCISTPGVTRDVAIVVTNNTAASFRLGAFGLVVLNPNTARLMAPFINDSSGFNGNPDADPAVSTLDWTCQPPLPDNDTENDGNPMTQQSFIDCRNGSANGPDIAPGASMTIASVRYTVPMMASPGSVALSFEGTGVFDESYTPLGACPGVPAMTCTGATIHLPALTMAIDCSAAPGIQSKCYVSNTLATRDINIVVRNNTTSAFPLGAFHFELVHLDDARMFAPVGMGMSSLDKNPDFIATAMGLANWNCGSGPGAPDNDTNTLPSDPGQRSKINCFQGSMAIEPMVGANATLALATVHYDIVAGADPGSMFLTVEEGGISDSFPMGRGGCPVYQSEPLMECRGAEIVFYCQIAQADAVHDGRVNSGDIGKIASKFNQIPAPANEDQNFDGMINSGDLGLAASVFNQYVSACP